jgi:hypothetical protein
MDGVGALLGSSLLMRAGLMRPIGPGNALVMVRPDESWTGYPTTLGPDRIDDKGVMDRREVESDPSIFGAGVTAEPRMAAAEGRGENEAAAAAAEEEAEAAAAAGGDCKKELNGAAEEGEGA